ncbi:hypothetical protein OG322_07165 [Streptomyces sp. NBC_01260]|uniref:hypothetical protein n=1 Tax=unclassified Streptomyces TaxID=2593676 RepID=UPI0011CECA91|nr:MULTISPECIES: hypothetical protein [unclassified Streptomyces]
MRFRREQRVPRSRVRGRQEPDVCGPAAGHLALDAVGRLRSNRAVEDPMSLSKESGRCADGTEAIAPRERIAATVRS